MCRNDEEAVNGVNADEVTQSSDDLSVTWLSLSAHPHQARCSTVAVTRDCSSSETTSCELSDLYSTVELVLPISTVEYAAA